MTAFTTKLNKTQKKTLERKRADTMERFVRFEPKSYIDMRYDTDPAVIASIPDDGQMENVCLTGNMTGELTGNITKNGGRYWKIRLTCPAAGITVTVLSFRYTPPSVYPDNGPVTVFGTLAKSSAYHSYSMVTDIIEQDPAERRMHARYPSMKGISAKKLNDLICEAVSEPFAEFIPEEVIVRNRLPHADELGRYLICPDSPEEAYLARRRISLEKMLYFAVGIKLREMPPVGKRPVVITSCEKTEALIKTLPFTLTDDQRGVYEAVRDALMNGEHLNALIQGDVACGKSIVAFLIMSLLIENGYQAVIMAPTVVLAKQHYDDLKVLFEPLGINVGFIGRTVTDKERRALLEDIRDGEISCIVGTHGLVEDDIEFKDLGVVIVDEEQRFGVEKREKLKDKTGNDIAFISMSATPIPRTLAGTIFGDSTKVYSIKQMPAGRKPVITTHLTEAVVPDVIGKETAAGHQAYIVCPMIEDNDDMEGVISVEALGDMYRQAFPSLEIGTLTGRDKKADSERILAGFRDGNVNILIATTVVEVGVNVPNATVIVIYNAERFGLSSLHQLRGRVKRGTDQPYCVLISEKEDNPRIQAMLDTEDGFEIAERDLSIRNAGDLLGEKQSGRNRILDEVTANPAAYESVKDIAASMVADGSYEAFMRSAEEIWGED